MHAPLTVDTSMSLRVGGKWGWWGCGLWVTMGQSQGRSQGPPGDCLRPLSCIPYSALLRCNWGSQLKRIPKVIYCGIRNEGRNAELARWGCLVCLGCQKCLGNTCPVVKTILISNINWWQGSMPVIIMRHHNRTGYHCTHKQLMHWRTRSSRVGHGDPLLSLAKQGPICTGAV